MISFFKRRSCFMQENYWHFFPFAVSSKAQKGWPRSSGYFIGFKRKCQPFQKKITEWCEAKTFAWVALCSIGMRSALIFCNAVNCWFLGLIFGAKFLFAWKHAVGLFSLKPRKFPDFYFESLVMCQFCLLSIAALSLISSYSLKSQFLFVVFFEIESKRVHNIRKIESFWLKK